MRRLLAAVAALYVLATVGAVRAESPGNVSVRLGLGTDISGGIAFGGFANYILLQNQNALEMGLAIFGGNFEEDSESGIYTYHEETDILVVGAMVNYLFRWSLDISGPYFLLGAGFGAVSVEWVETSPNDTSLGPPLAGGGSSQSEDGTVGGFLLNFGIGHRFSEKFDLRGAVPVMFVGAGDERDGAIIPMLTVTGGVTF